ncbi:hypothetical protein ACIBL3_33930 [Kribbella sp. NPDC050124]|uniref:hypothetical protein n=1 Tax=Kribbella sp. NPDC050124 TaxID=3364114 RepID=UPI0037B756F5
MLTSDEFQLPQLTVQQSPARNMAARLPGILALNEAANCLVVDKNGRHIDVAWPPGWSVALRDGSIALIDATGQTFAKLGDTVSLGGGYILASVAHTTSCLGTEKVWAVASAPDTGSVQRSD